MSLNKETVNRIKAWPKENMAIIVAVLFSMLCIGLLSSVVSVIDNTLLYLTDFGRHVSLDWLFILLTGFGVYYVAKHWFIAKRIVSPRLTGALLVLLVLYVIFRFIDQKHYNFTSYWNGPIAYLDGFALIGLALLVLYLIQQVKKLFKEEDYAKS